MQSAIGFSIPSVISAIFGSWISVATYILTAIAVMKMGRKIRAGAPWLSWIPGPDAYALGRVADEDSRRRGRPETKFRILLPILTGLAALLTALVVVMVIALAMGTIIAIFGGFYDWVSGVDTTGTDMEGLAALVGLLILARILMLLLSIPRLIALWHVYRVFCPDRAILFLMLNIFVNVTIPVTLMIASAREPIPEYSFGGTPPDGFTYDPRDGGFSGTETL